MDLYRISVDIELSDDHDERADQIVAARGPRQDFAKALKAAGIDADVVAQVVAAQSDAPAVKRGRPKNAQTMTAEQITGTPNTRKAA